MKKFIKLIACLIVCVMAMTAFVSCDFSLGHTYSYDWEYDENTHYHACTSEACDAKKDVEEHDFEYDDYIEDEGVVYYVEKCSVCFYEKKTEVVGGVLVDDTESAQAALDAATDGDVIILYNGYYDTLYIRQTEDSTPVDSNWAGGGHTFLREFDGVTVMGYGDVSVTGIVLEAATYTPDGNQHSNSATVPYLNSLINISDLTIKDITFDLDENGTAFKIAHCNTEINGLTIENCVVNGNNGTGRAIYSTADTFADVSFIDCIFNGLEQGMNINDVQGLTVQGCEFNAVVSRDILVTGPVSGTVTISGNTSNGGTERFIRMAGVAADATIVLTENTVENYAGADNDIVKINVTATTVVEVSGNDWDGETDDEAKESGVLNIIVD